MGLSLVRPRHNLPPSSCCPFHESWKPNVNPDSCVVMETCFNTLDVGGSGGTTDFICEQQCRNPASRVCSRTRWKLKEQNTNTSSEWNSDYGWCKDGLTLGRLVITIAVVRDGQEHRRLTASPCCRRRIRWILKWNHSETTPRDSTIRKFCYAMSK